MSEAVAAAIQGDESSSRDYVLVDSIQDVYDSRQSVRIEAETLLESRRDGQRLGVEAMMPPVDALSTAHSVLDMSRTYGQDSLQCQERYAGLLLDCQRLVAEWYRKKKSEYFPPVRHEFDGDSEEFFSHGLSVSQMTYNALVPIVGNREEERRRVNERVEDATPQILRRLGAIAVGKQSIRTISECTDKAELEYAEDQASGAEHRGYGGYVPEIRKYMVRDIRLNDKDGARYEEQIALPGRYHTHDIITETLRRRGVDAQSMDKTQLHGSQLLVQDSLMDFAAQVDEVASEQWCTTIFMGEEVPDGFVKDYDNFRQEAMQRQAGLQEQSDTVASFVLDLARDNVDRLRAPAMVEEFVKKLLLGMAKQDPSIAEQMFDERTAEGLREVAWLESQGEYEQADNKMREVEELAPGGGYCGADCGLETVNTSSATGKELARNLKAEAGDTVVKDKVRNCRCGSKSVAYAYSKKKVNKYCDSCGAFESKTSLVA